jgi:hypothetical protein
MTTTEKESSCPICGQEIEPDQPRISRFTKDAALNTTERGSIHLAHSVQEQP